MPVPHDTLRLLGLFQLVQSGQPVTLGQARLEEVLAYLATRPGIPVPRVEIAYQLWPDSNDPQARTNLRKALLMLRRRLPDADALIQVERQQLMWRADAPCSVDVTQFTAEIATAQAEASPAAVRRHLEKAVALYAGELLPGCYADWIMPLREQLRQAYMDALDRPGRSSWSSSGTTVRLSASPSAPSAMIHCTRRAICV